MRKAFIALMFCTVAAGAEAAPSASPQEDQSVTLSPVAVPIVVGGRLANYIFVTVRVVLRPGADQGALRDKEPYFRDALVRAAHRAPFVLASDYNHVDQAKLKSAMMRESIAIAGPAAIRDIVIVEQTAQHQVRSPRADAVATH